MYFKMLFAVKGRVISRKIPVGFDQGAQKMLITPYKRKKKINIKYTMDEFRSRQL